MGTVKRQDPGTEIHQQYYRHSTRGLRPRRITFNSYYWQHFSVNISQFSNFLVFNADDQGLDDCERDTMVSCWCSVRPGRTSGQLGQGPGMPGIGGGYRGRLLKTTGDFPNKTNNTRIFG